jgi:hypothetical protein
LPSDKNLVRTKVRFGRDLDFLRPVTLGRPVAYQSQGFGTAKFGQQQLRLWLLESQ